jgi:hypothetical protein
MEQRTEDKEQRSETWNRGREIRNREVRQGKKMALLKSPADPSILPYGKTVWCLCMVISEVDTCPPLISPYTSTIHKHHTVLPYGKSTDQQGISTVPSFSPVSLLCSLSPVLCSMFHFSVPCLPSSVPCLTSLFLVFPLIVPCLTSLFLVSHPLFPVSRLCSLSPVLCSMSHVSVPCVPTSVPCLTFLFLVSAQEQRCETWNRGRETRN